MTEADFIKDLDRLLRDGFIVVDGDEGDQFEDSDAVPRLSVTARGLAAIEVEPERG